MDGDVPPSYGDAVRRDPWHLIVPYLSRRDLRNLVRVNKAIGDVANAHLWGFAMQHFGRDGQDVYVTISNISKYHKALASPSTRQATKLLPHTLYLSPVSEEHFGFNSWNYRQILPSLPSLQALVVTGMNSVDHNLLMEMPRLLSRKLRVLIARECPNATSKGLANLAANMHELQYLDLSYTKAAGQEPFVSYMITSCGRLEVLKLRGTGLKMVSLDKVVRNAFENPHLETLDVRDNRMQIDGFSLSIASSIRDLNRSSSSSTCVDPRDHAMELLRSVMLQDVDGQSRASNRSGSGSLKSWYLSGNSISLVPGGIDIFARVDMSSVDVSQNGKHAITPVLNNLALRNGNTLRHLRADILNFPTSHTILSQDNASAAGLDLPPSYDEDEAFTQGKTLSSHLLEYFPALETLTLTGIPAFASSAGVIESITTIFRICGQLSRLSSSARTPYMRTYRLRTIILEVTLPMKRHDSAFSYTDDRHMEAFWDENLEDFSFFSDEKHGRERASSRSSTASVPKIDVVAQLARWREQRRADFTRCKFHGLELTAAAREHWPGAVQIVRVQPGMEKPHQDGWDRLAYLREFAG